MPPNGEHLAGIFDTATGAELCQLPPDWIHKAVTFSADEATFACQDHFGVIHIASTANGKLKGSLGIAASDQEFRDSILKFSPDGQYLASLDTTSDSVIVWEIAQGKQCLRLPGIGMSGHSLRTVFCWSPDGRMLAEVRDFSNKVIRIWEVSTGSLRREFKGHEGSVLALAFSPDSRYLASGSADTTVLIWDLWAAGGNP